MSQNIGEKTAINYYFKQGYTIQPVMDNPNYWYKDIDLVIMKDDQIKTIECKYDNWLATTQLMFIEEYTNIDKLTDGWIKFIQADLIWYLDSVKMIAYIFKTQDLKDYIEKHDSTLQRKKAPDKDRYGNIRKVSQGIMVPIGDFGKEYKITAVPL